MLVVALVAGCSRYATSPNAGNRTSFQLSLQEAVAKSSELTALEVAARDCPAIDPMVRQIQSGDFKEAWFGNSWVPASRSLLCELAYSKAWEILWPISNLVEFVERRKASVIELSSSYPWLEEAALKVVSSEEFELHLRRVGRVCRDEGLGEPTSEPVQCNRAVDAFEKHARFSSFAGRAKELQSQIKSGGSIEP